jgi:hypothetical protein
MYLKNTVQAIPLTILDTSTLTGVYISLTTLPQPCFYIRVYNASTVPLILSYDGGVTNHDVVGPAMTIQLNAQTNSQPNNHVALFPRGQMISVKGTVGAGLAYLVGYYQPTGA